MADKTKNDTKSSPSEEKKSFLDKLEEIVDDASHQIMNEAGDVQHKLESVVDDLEERVSGGLKSVTESARRVVEYAEDGVEAIELRRDIRVLRENMNANFMATGKKIWELHRANQLDQVEKACARELSRFKKLQDQIDKKEVKLKILS